MLKVLVAEDEAPGRDALVSKVRHILQDEGMTEAAVDGSAAIRLALEMKPDLVLMDIVMPVMNGLDAAEVIHEHLPQTAIVFLTAYDSFDYAVRALRAGSRDYLLKPVSERDLRQLLERLFQIGGGKEARGAKSPFVSAVDTWMLTHYPENVSLEDAAHCMGMSAPYFSRKLKAETGKTFLERLTALRVENAMQRLCATSMSVNEIGRSVGYPDPNYFVKVFKRSTGMTPSEYRAARKED